MIAIASLSGPGSSSSSATKIRRLVHLRRRQPDAVILVHRLDHVVDEFLHERIAKFGFLERPGALRAGPGCPIRATLRIDIRYNYRLRPRRPEASD